MRQTKTKQYVDIIDGNQLIGKVIDKNDPEVETCVNLINELPDSKNIERVMKIKQQIDAGDYDFDSKLDSVVNAIINESEDKNTIAYPLFEH